MEGVVETGSGDRARGLEFAHGIDRDGPKWIAQDGPKWIAPDRPDIDCPGWTCQTAARGPISGDDNAPQGRLWNGLIDQWIDQLKLDSLNPSRGSMGSINHRSPGGRYKALSAESHREPIEP